MSYCEYVKNLDKNNLHRIYHDTQYGFRIEDDNELFCRLMLEINQAGLSWNIILNKEQNFRRAFNDFKISTVANYGDEDRFRLLNDSGIIRNRLKINAAIENAKTILTIQNEHGSFKDWLDFHQPLSLEEWTKLFKKKFKFTGGEIVKEFLMSTAYLKGAHIPKCPIQEIINHK